MEQTSPEVLTQALKLAAQVMTQEMKNQIEELVREAIGNVVQEAMNNCDFVREEAVREMIESANEDEVASSSDLRDLERVVEEKADQDALDSLERQIDEKVDSDDVDELVRDILREFFERGTFSITPQR
jgi:N-methylhydantoinase B/oxoprolinase/acetone carboxylase alpha subunit